MGFAGADPRQLAPSVGTTQVGITISAVPSSENRNPGARTRSNPLEGLKITANIFATPAASIETQPRQIQRHGNDQARRQRRRNRRPRRTARNLYEGVPLEEARRAVGNPQIFRQTTATRTPAAHHDDGYESDTSSQQYHRQGRRNRRPKRRAREIYNKDQSNVTTQSRSQGSPDESLHAHLTTAKTATQRRRSASTMTRNGDQTNSPTSSSIRT